MSIKDKFNDKKHIFYNWLNEVSETVELFFKGVFSGFLIAIVVIIVLSFIPFFIVWAMNTILEQGGFTQHINHGFFTYLAIYTLIVIYMLINKALE